MNTENPTTENQKILIIPCRWSFCSNAESNSANKIFIVDRMADSAREQSPCFNLLTAPNEQLAGL